MKKYEFTEEEVNTIASMVAVFPYKDAFPIIDYIKSIIAKQMPEANEQEK